MYAFHRRSAFLLPLLFAALAPEARLRAQASDLQAFARLTSDYNLISFGNAELSFTSQDVEGPVAVGGSLTLGGDPLVALSTFDDSANPTLYVAGTFSIANNQTVQLDNGYAALPGNAGAGTYPYQGSPTRYQPAGTQGYLEVNSSVAYSNTNPTTNPIGVWATTPMSSVQSQLEQVSTDLAGDSANGSISVSGQTLTFTGAASGITIFDLNADNLTVSGGTDYYDGHAFTSVGMSIPTGADYVVNVTNAGSDPNVIFGQPNFNLGSTEAGQLLWNLVGTGSATLGDGGQFYGSVLAPQMTISNGANDPVTGQIVAGSVDYQNAELHSAPLIAIPEPNLSAAWMGLLALLLAIVLPNCHRPRTIS
jgi:choice-of-anchor A domain-containing protein